MSTTESIKHIEHIRNHLTALSTEDHMPSAHFNYLKKLKDSGFEPKVIYDIGSCVLHWTNGAKRLWPNATYYLFDAFESAEFLYVRDGYDYHMGVLSDEDGKVVKWHQNDIQPGGNSYYREVGCGPISGQLFPENGYVEKITRTLDSVVKERGFPKPDLLKMDVQGAEKDILSGAKDTLSSVRHLIVEMQHVDYNLGAPKVDETLPFIESLGFECVAPRFCGNADIDADYGFVAKDYRAN